MLNWIVLNENLVASLGGPFFDVSVFVIRLEFDLFTRDFVLLENIFCSIFWLRNFPINDCWFVFNTSAGLRGIFDCTGNEISSLFD
jgi:hypothetical protein